MFLRETIVAISADRDRSASPVDDGSAGIATDAGLNADGLTAPVRRLVRLWDSLSAHARTTETRKATAQIIDEWKQGALPAKRPSGRLGDTRTQAGGASDPSLTLSVAHSTGLVEYDVSGVIQDNLDNTPQAYSDIIGASNVSSRVLVLSTTSGSNGQVRCSMKAAAAAPALTDAKSPRLPTSRSARSRIS